MLERPDHGARVRFDRVEVSDDATAIYTARVWLPEGELAYRIELSSASSEATFEPLEGETDTPIEPPPWLQKYLQSMARQLVRAGGWPRKLVQWHSP